MDVTEDVAAVNKVVLHIKVDEGKAAQVGDERHAAQRRAVRVRGVAVRAQYASGYNGVKTRFSSSCY
ncbi:hypothetical protein PF003_g21440 [Phytophthora fragariae]|nr:hypothetical protein PF003_g21440 [Phytophthora fragariae]